MRRVLLGAALGALLTILVAAPAGAVPPNEILIARNLQRVGIVPSYATPFMACAAAQALAAKGPDYQTKPAAGAKASGDALGSYLAAKAATGKAAGTYAAHTLVLLVEFGTGAWPDGDSAGHDMNGPTHGTIKAPALDDNATFWPGDFSPMHYQQMLFGNSYPIYGVLRAAGKSGKVLPAGRNALPYATQVRGYSDDTMRNYYLEQSHGAYTVQGDIKNWVKLDLPESYYGANSAEGTDDLTGPVWRVARDAITKFAEENPGFDWARYDQENPFGITGADFNQPDGYLDHVILVHAGSDESAGGGAQLTDAIWAHSWDIYENLSGGPGDGPGMIIPGTEGQGPQGKGIWAYNYTINPEDGDVGVFCHEFGHDLGLPDEYDYSSTTGDASSGFWTIMAGGSWLGRQWGIGTKPAEMNVWDKTALGFVQPRTVKRGKDVTLKLQAAENGDATRTGVKIELPKARHTIKLSGADGAKEWYSTMGNDEDVSLDVKDPVAVSTGTELTYRTWYDIEQGYDFGFVEVSADDGATWDTVRQYTGSDTGHWADTQTVDLSAYAGKSVHIRFEYRTDGGVALKGWELTDIAVGGSTLPQAAFASDGWLRLDGEWTRKTDRYYIAEYRTYNGFDEGLKNCYQWNYNYVDADGNPTWVDWYSYNKGLHLIYRDAFWNDNDVATHVGRGGWMVVDAHPKPMGVTYSDGTRDYFGYWRPRIQVRDAAFGTVPTKTQSVYFVDYDEGVAAGEDVVPARGGQTSFNDTRSYWYADAPEAGVKIPQGLGVRIVVKSMSSDEMTVRVDNVQ